MRAAVRRRILYRRRPSLPAGPWTPTALGSSMVAWWNADDLANGSVAAWIDRVAALSAAQGTSGNQPTKAATSWPSGGGKPGVTFTTDDYLETGSIAATAIPLGTAASLVFAAASIPALTGSNTLVGYGSNSTGRRMVITGTETLQLVKPSDTTFSNPASGSSLGDHINMGRWSGTTMEGRVDGDAPFTTALVSALDTVGDRLRIGANETTTPGAILSTGVIRHVFVTLDLVQADREKLEGWIAWDCGIQTQLPVAHPYRSAAP